MGTLRGISLTCLRPVLPHPWPLEFLFALIRSSDLCAKYQGHSGLIVFSLSKDELAMNNFDWDVTIKQQTQNFGQGIDLKVKFQHFVSVRALFPDDCGQFCWERYKRKTLTPTLFPENATVFIVIVFFLFHHCVVSPDSIPRNLALGGTLTSICSPF